MHSQRDMWELTPMERRYAVPPSCLEGQGAMRGSTSEDLHAWSIYRQNLNSDFTDSALGSSEKSPLPYGNFQLRESTVHSILNHPRYGPKSELGSNMFTYLKFGLPRVLPPSRGPREGSSGYDSSDDGSPTIGNRNFKRAKSDPDFRNHVIGRQEVGAATGGDSGWSRERRMKSSSEANLLNADVYNREQYHRSGRTSHGSRVDSRNRHHHDGFSDAGTRPDSRLQRHRRPGSKVSGSQLSLASRGSKVKDSSPSMRADGMLDPTPHLIMHDKLFASTDIDEGGIFKQPHLQIRNLTYETRKGKTIHRLLDSVSFEVNGGEIMGVMATSDEEGTILLNILCDRYPHWGARVNGEFVLNGVPVSPRKMAERFAYVQRDHNFHQDLSVTQTMQFQARLHQPGNATRGHSTTARIGALIEDLGLGQVKDTRNKDLTSSERQRLNVACHLLLDTDVVVLDDPTRGMDIFDTFFLVEYLRQWAARGRIVILTIHPPTYEIFTMICKVALLSTGRLMYSGKRREMLPYFAFIDYPCPAYKNPSDYYLDLVTLDTLSAEAMLESSQRIEQLSETFRRRQEPLSEPGPAGILPGKVRRSGFINQTIALWIRAISYTFPFNLIHWVKMILLAGSLSVLTGAIFWKLRMQNEQQNVDDRFGFYYSMMAIAPWPLWLVAINEVMSDRGAVYRDVQDGLYSKLAYILSKFTYNFLATLGVFLTFVIPSYAMAGLNSGEAELNKFYFYIGYMLLFLYTIRTMAMAVAYLVASKHLAALISGCIFMAISLTCGIILHFSDLNTWSSYIHYGSPMYWVLYPLVKSEFKAIAPFSCPLNPVVNLPLGITTRSECGLKSGNDVLTFMSFNEKWTTNRELNNFLPLIATVLFGAVFFLFAILFVLLCLKKPVVKNSEVRSQW